MKKILIVDDEQSLTSSLVSFLGTILQVQAFGAYKYQEAVDIFDKEDIDLLILDYNLKEKMTGLDVLKKAREKKPDIKSLMITGNVTNELEEECHALGLMVIIHKPLVLMELKEAIEKSLKE